MNHFITVDKHHQYITARNILIWIGMCFGSSATTMAVDDALVLVIQPILSETKTRVAFAPPAQCFSKVTGKKPASSPSPIFRLAGAKWRKLDSPNLIRPSATFMSARTKFWRCIGTTENSGLGISWYAILRTHPFALSKKRCEVTIVIGLTDDLRHFRWHLSASSHANCITLRDFGHYSLQ